MSVTLSTKSTNQWLNEINQGSITLGAYLDAMEKEHSTVDEEVFLTGIQKQPTIIRIISNEKLRARYQFIGTQLRQFLDHPEVLALRERVELQTPPKKPQTPQKPSPSSEKKETLAQTLFGSPSANQKVPSPPKSNQKRIRSLLALSEKERDDKGTVFPFLARNAKGFEHVSKRLKNDPFFIAEVLQVNPGLVLPDEMLQIPRIFLMAVLYGKGYIHRVPKKFKQDPILMQRICLYAVLYQPSNIWNLPPDIKSQIKGGEGVIFSVIKSEPNWKKQLIGKFGNVIVEEDLSQEAFKVVKTILHPTDRFSQQFAELMKNYKGFFLIPEEERNRIEIARHAVTLDPWLLLYAPPVFIKQLALEIIPKMPLISISHLEGLEDDKGNLLIEDPEIIAAFANRDAVTAAPEVLEAVPVQPAEVLEAIPVQPPEVLEAILVQAPEVLPAIPVQAREEAVPFIPAPEPLAVQVQAPVDVAPQAEPVAVAPAPAASPIVAEVQVRQEVVDWQGEAEIKAQLAREAMVKAMTEQSSVREMGERASPPPAAPESVKRHWFINGLLWFFSPITFVCHLIAKLIKR